MVKHIVSLVAACAALVAMTDAAEARSGGRANVQIGVGVGVHHGHWHRGHGHWRFGFWGGVGYWPYYGPYYAADPYWAPSYVVVDPPHRRYELRDAPAAPAAPDPVFTPRSGQSWMQMEGDRQACNRFATTQADAMADAQVFHRTTLACMEQRGYSVR